MSEQVILFESKATMERALGRRNLVEIIVNGTNYLLARDHENFFLLETRCPHFDHPLIEGSINKNGQLTCPWHNYGFDLNTGQEVSGRCRQLQVKPARWNEKGMLEITI